MKPSGWLAFVFLLLAGADAAIARESCTFVRDPAFWAHSPVAPAVDGELAIGTLNAFRLFDDEQDDTEKTVLSEAQFTARIDRMARYVAADMGAPAILALQEVEDETSVRALAQALRRETGRAYQYVLGEVSGDSDVRSVLLVDARLRVTAKDSLFGREARAGKPLHDRQPLLVEIDTGGKGRLTLVVVHMKSMRGLQNPRDAGRVADKRRYQAQELADWSRAHVSAGRRLVVLGDFNATILDSDSQRSEPMKIILGSSGLLAAAGRFLQPSQRWTFRYRCALNELDHVLVSPALLPFVSGYAISRGDTCIRAREKCDSSHSVSDHEGVVLRLMSPEHR